ncbi:MAG: mechanosensitive ion channel family protein [Candidatus Poribacteria bacterium]|nr:mechanosensitive ion channel family protein [Candidatus Poribacteria bacterium]
MDALINLWTELDESLASIMSKALIKFVYAMLVLLALLITYRVTKGLIIAAMRRSNRTEAQVMQFLSMWRYSFMLVGVVFVIVSLSGSLAAMGLTVAFISMILGWSLQRPVTGVAAWLMVMIKRPFVIGDRIIVQGVRGDVLDISPTHILLGEVGGTIGGEESSNRGILIPNAILFDQMVINYAVSEEAKYILDEVPVRVSYDSDYELAEQTLISCAREVTSEIIQETGLEPEVRAEFFDSGIMMRLRYRSIAVDRQRISTRIVAKVMEAFSNSPHVGFAYPHSAVEYRLSNTASLPPMYDESQSNRAAN